MEEASAGHRSARARDPRRDPAADIVAAGDFNESSTSTPGGPRIPQVALVPGGERSPREAPGARSSSRATPAGWASRGTGSCCTSRGSRCPRRTADRTPTRAHGRRSITCCCRRALRRSGLPYRRGSFRGRAPALPPEPRRHPEALGLARGPARATRTTSRSCSTLDARELTLPAGALGQLQASRPCLTCGPLVYTCPWKRTPPRRSTSRRSSPRRAPRGVPRSVHRSPSGPAERTCRGRSPMNLSLILLDGSHGGLRRGVHANRFPGAPVAAGPGAARASTAAAAFSSTTRSPTSARRRAGRTPRGCSPRSAARRGGRAEAILPRLDGNHRLAAARGGDGGRPPRARLGAAARLVLPVARAIMTTDALPEGARAGAVGRGSLVGHRQGRGHDRAEHGHDAVLPLHGRRGGPRRAARRARLGVEPHAEPHLDRRRPEHERHGRAASPRGEGARRTRRVPRGAAGVLAEPCGGRREERRRRRRTSSG